jgi:hypothetical protein
MSYTQNEQKKTHPINQITQLPCHHHQQQQKKNAPAIPFLLPETRHRLPAPLQKIKVSRHKASFQTLGVPKIDHSHFNACSQSRVIAARLAAMDTRVHG